MRCLRSIVADRCLIHFQGLEIDAVTTITGGKITDLTISPSPNSNLIFIFISQLNHLSFIPASVHPFSAHSRSRGFIVCLRRRSEVWDEMSLCIFLLSRIILESLLQFLSGSGGTIHVLALRFLYRNSRGEGEEPGKKTFPWTCEVHGFCTS